MPDVRTVWADALRPEDAEAYDLFVDEAEGGHYAQTRAWAKVAVAGRPRVARYFLAREGERVVGAALVMRAAAGPLALPSAIVERGPVCGAVADVPRVVRALAGAGRRHGIARMSVMPYWTDTSAAEVERELASAGWKDIQRADGAHVSTLRLDLRDKPDEALFAGKEREQVRWRRKQAEKAGATARRGTREDFAVFQAQQREMMAAQGRSDKPAAWYGALWDAMLDGKRGALFVCEHEGAIVGTVVALRHGAVATYAHGATASRETRFTKTILPLVLAVRWARDEGCGSFDLGGVPMEGDADEKRVAISKLKFDFARARVRLVREHARWF